MTLRVELDERAGGRRGRWRRPASTSASTRLHWRRCATGTAPLRNALRQPVRAFALQPFNFILHGS